MGRQSRVDGEFIYITQHCGKCKKKGSEGNGFGLKGGDY